MKILKNFNFYKFSIFCFALILYLSFMDLGEVKPPKVFFFFGRFDLFAHFSMYFGLSFIFFIEKFKKFEYNDKSLKFSKSQMFILLFIFISFMIEVFQPIISNRSRELSDFLANIVGSYSGYFCMRLLTRIFHTVS